MLSDNRNSLETSIYPLSSFGFFTTVIISIFSNFVSFSFIPFERSFAMIQVSLCLKLKPPVLLCSEKSYSENFAIFLETHPRWSPFLVTILGIV